MITLRAFGALDVRSDGGAPLTSLLTQSKRAALFTYLVVSRPGEMHRRDALLALFWPDLDQQHARNALSQSLSFLRRELDNGVLVTRGAEEVGVDAAAVTSDVGAFEAALAAEDWAAAVDAYVGDLLEGLHVSGAAPFTDWVDRERERLREAAAAAAWKQAHARIAAGELTEAERVAQRALALVPTDESPVRAFIEALAGSGDRAAALRFYERFVGVLAQELEVEPAPETVAVMEAVRARTEAVEVARLAEPAHTASAESREEESVSSSVVPVVGRSPPRRTLRLGHHPAIAWVAMVGVVLGAYGVDARNGRMGRPRNADRGGRCGQVRRRRGGRPVGSVRPGSRKGGGGVVARGARPIRHRAAGHAGGGRRRAAAYATRPDAPLRRGDSPGGGDA